MPTTKLECNDLSEGKIGILTLLVKTGLASSNGEGRRLVQQGGISINDVKIMDPSEQISFEENNAIIKKGKKVFHKVVIK